MTDDFDKLLAECPPTEADRAWAREVLAKLAADQRPMDADIEVIVFDNLWGLYVEDDAPAA